MCDYISREDVLVIASQYCPDDDGSCSKADVDLREMLDEIEALPAADVQPIKYRNEWISVEDQLPEVGESVLVCVVINAKVNIPSRQDDTPEIRIGWLDENGKWGLQFANADKDEVLYWRPLPEIPNEDYLKRIRQK